MISERLIIRYFSRPKMRSPCTNSSFRNTNLNIISLGSPHRLGSVIVSNLLPSSIYPA
jgi:hypothetical protein